MAAKSSKRKIGKKTVATAAVALSAAELAAQERRQAPPEIRNSLDLPLDIQSRAALITNAKTGEMLYGKNYNQTMPIASITKLMTAMVVLDAGLDMNDPVTVTQDDVDKLRNTHSRLSIGTTLTRADMMLIALMASENRAAASLARSYPGGTQAAIAAMNRKAAKLGMTHTRFHDGTGLSGDNTSTPGDLAKMVQAAYRYADIRAFSTTPQYQVQSRGHLLQYKNTNLLVKEPDWDIGVSKTGFINEAGKCLVMMARIRDEPVIIVLMDSWGKYTRIGDANRVKQWLERVTRV
ncbi:MAG: D-alanyl-D-alanine endopeptidase [Pseudomonadota bacterium]